MADDLLADTAPVHVAVRPPHSPLFARLKVQFGGRTLIAGDERKAIIGKGLADKLGKQVGDKIPLYADDYSFEIVGIYEGPIIFENNGLIVPLKDLQRMMNREGEVTGFAIVAEHPIDAKGLEELRRRIKAIESDLEVTVATQMDSNTKQANEPKPTDAK